MESAHANSSGRCTAGGCGQIAWAAASLQRHLTASDSAYAHPSWIDVRRRVLAAHAAGAKLVVLVGERGSGKTRMLHDLAQSLRAGGETAWFWQPLRLDVDAAFGGVVLIDDAERVEPPLFEEIRRGEALSLIVAGKPELLQHVGVIAAAPSVILLKPLGRRAMHRVVVASAAQAGLRRTSLRPRVIDCLHGWSGGSTRQAIALAAGALAATAAAGADRLTVQIVDQVAIDLGLERRLAPPEPATAISRLAPAAMAAAVVLVGAVAVAALRHSSISRSSAGAPDLLLASRVPPAPEPPRFEPSPTVEPAAATPAQETPDAALQPSSGLDASADVAAMTLRSTPAGPPTIASPGGTPAVLPSPESTTVAPQTAPAAAVDETRAAADATTPIETAAPPDQPIPLIAAADADAPALPADRSSDAVAETQAAVRVRMAALPRASTLVPSGSNGDPAPAGGMAAMIVRPDLPSSTTRVAVSYGDGDPAAARAARALAQALRARGYLVDEPVAAHGRTSPAGVRYYFAEDAAAASRVAQQVAAVYADAGAQRAPAHQPWPRPGTIEVVVPARPVPAH